MKKHLSNYSLLLLLFGFLSLSTVGMAVSIDTARVWTGEINTNWFEPGNWQGSTIPATIDKVLIPSDLPRYPILTATDEVVCKDLTISDSEDKDKNPAGGRMVISGDFVIDGNLTIKTGGFLDITNGGALTINGNLKNNGSMVIENGGSLITTGTVTGTASVIREIPNDLGWHFISSPVDYQEICNGTFAPLVSNFSTTPITTWDFYTWSPNCPVDPLLRWRNLRNLDLTVNTADFGDPPKFDVRKGYLAAYGSGFSTTKTFTGTPNTGDQTFSFSDVTNNCSWELAGNPFPSAFSWDDVPNKANLTSGYYFIWNEVKTGGAGYEAFLDDTYHTSNVNGNIPPMQGFFLKVDPTKDKILNVPNSARVHDSNHWLKKPVTSPANRLTITMGTPDAYDETFIIFGPNGSADKDWYDAEKMFSFNEQASQVYTLVENDLKALINAMPFSGTPFTVPVGIKVFSDGMYTFKLSGFDSFASIPGMILEDRTTGISHNILLNPVYAFHATGNEDAGRFLLHFTGPIGFDEKDICQINIYSSENSVFVSSPAGFHNAKLTICNLLGQEIITHKLSNQPVNRIQVNTGSGYYIVKVQDESSVKTAKVYIN